MKKQFYILLLALTVMSCNTVEKMVEKGQYDQAFSYSVQHLAGKKAKKTKYVTALEDAYIRLNNRDIKEIEFLMLKGSPASWGRVYDLYIKLEKRQNLISSLIPLESKDGYVAHFEMTDYSNDKLEIISKSTEYHYSKALSHIKEARNGNKRAARRAMTSLNDVNKYFQDYKKSNELKDEAMTLGTEHIAVEFVDNDRGWFDEIAMDRIKSIDISRFNTYWEKFHRYDGTSNYDNYVVIELQNIDLGLEREYVDRNSFYKEIEDGYDIEEKITVTNHPYVKKENGGKKVDKKGDKVVIDTKEVTTKEVVKKIKYRKVYADIVEIKRERLSNMFGVVKVFRNDSDHPVYENLIRVDFDFRDEAVRLNGDRRALPTIICNRLKANIADFPSDYAVVDQLSFDFSSIVGNEINRYDFLYN